MRAYWPLSSMPRMVNILWKSVKQGNGRDCCQDADQEPRDPSEQETQAEKDYPLGPCHHPVSSENAKAFTPGSQIADPLGEDQGEQQHGNEIKSIYVAMIAPQGVETKADKQCRFAETVEYRIQQSTEWGILLGEARQCAVQQVQYASRQEDNATPDEPASGHETGGSNTDGESKERDGIWCEN